MSQKKRKGMWQQMPDTLLMDSSGWWGAEGLLSDGELLVTAPRYSNMPTTTPCLS